MLAIGAGPQKSGPLLFVETIMSEPKLSSVAPIFQVANMQRAIDYYKRVLGFEIEWTAGEPPTHASVSRDSVEISLTEEGAPVPLRVSSRSMGSTDTSLGCSRLVP